MDVNNWLQLGIGGASLFVLFSLGRLIITKWSEAQAAQNKTWADALAAQNKTIGEGFRSIIDSHKQMVSDNQAGYNAMAAILHEHHGKVAGQIGNLRDWVIAIDSKLSASMDLTPIRMQRPDLVQPVDKTLVSATAYLDQQPPQPPPPQQPNTDDEVTPPLGTPPVPPPPTPTQAPLRTYNRPPTPVPVPQPERPLSPTGRAQNVPRPVGGEYSGAIKKPR